MALTAKQSAFIDEYMIDLNASQAAIRAGYSAKTAEWIGPQLLKKSHVAEEIAKGMAKRQIRTDLTADQVLANIDLIRKDAMRDAFDKEGNQTMLNHAAALRACELLGKHMGMFGDKMALTIESTPEEDIDKRIAELLVATSAAQQAQGRGEMH
jgi:phage terminase small subunit